VISRGAALDTGQFLLQPSDFTPWPFISPHTLLEPRAYLRHSRIGNTPKVLAYLHV